MQIALAARQSPTAGTTPVAIRVFGGDRARRKRQRGAAIACRWPLELSGVDWVEAIWPVLLGGTRQLRARVLALAVEGGGMRGAVSSGMCVVLEAAGLLPAFDRIYGTSAGALNGAAAAAGQAAMSSTHYQDAVLGRVIYPLRAAPAADHRLRPDVRRGDRRAQAALVGGLQRRS